MNRQLVVTGVALVAVFLLFRLTEWDLAIQDKLYVPPKGWSVNKDEPIGKLIFYTGPKLELGVFGGVCLLTFLLSFHFVRLVPYRCPALLMCLSLAAVPGTVAALKHVSGVYTPSEVRRYGGMHEYAHPFQRQWQKGDSGKAARGFPAGHASGGFALMMLYFALRDRRARILGLLGGISVGWIMGVYQTLNGQHFFSHTPITMVLAWVIILLVAQIFPPPDLQPAS